MPDEQIGGSFAHYRIDSKILAGTGSMSPVERAVSFYEEATDDYEYWSSGFNMHLGFYRRGVGFLDLERMLEQMNLEVARRLQLQAEDPSMLIDLGCGAGAISRTIARNHPNAIIKGVTVSPIQVKTAKRLNRLAGLGDRIELVNCDFRELPFEDGSADGVWAVESACYATGAGKNDLVREMARVLKHGGRFVVADCFLKKPEVELRFPAKHCYSSVCKSWALIEMPVLDRFVAALQSYGFRDLLVEDISWRVAPSLLHAPGTVLGFILKKTLTGGQLKPHSVKNLRASLLAPVLGLNRSKFSYCLISGTLVV